MSNSENLTFTNFHKTKYKQLFNKLYKINNNLDEKNYLLNYNKKKLLDYITNLDLSYSTREGFLFMVARYLDINKPNDPNIKDFKQMGYEYKIKRDEIEGRNELDEQEKEAYRSLDFFKKKIKEKDIKNLNDTNRHYGYLITALLSLAPPLRTSFYNSCIIVRGESAPQDKSKNYILINKTEKNLNIYYIVNDDKVSNTKYYSSRPELSKIEIQDMELKNIIMESIKMKPRTYLFESASGAQMKDTTITKYLRDFTGVDKLTINIMRSIVITNFYNKVNTSYNDKTDLANAMRNSVTTQQKNYKKIIKEDENEEKNE